MLSLLMYDTLFSNTQVGTGSGLAVILALVTLAAGVVTVRLLYREQEA
jgi:ABC-type sugar transport system permease subunit